MTEQNDDSWVGSAARFIESAGDDLGDRYAPQLKALRAIAAALDAGDGFDAGLVAEFSRMHRWLINKSGASSPSGAGRDDEPDLLDMLAVNPGALWKAN